MSDQKLTFTVSGRDQGAASTMDTVARASGRAEQAFDRAQVAAQGLTRTTTAAAQAETQHATATQAAATAARAKADALAVEAAAAERAAQKAEQLAAKRRGEADAARRAFDEAERAGDPKAIDFEPVIDRAERAVAAAEQKAERARRIAVQAQQDAIVAEGQANGAALAANGLASDLAQGQAQRAQVAARATGELASSAQQAATAIGAEAGALNTGASAAQAAAQAASGLTAATAGVAAQAQATAQAITASAQAEQQAAAGFGALSAAAERTVAVTEDAAAASNMLAGAASRDARATLGAANARERAAVSTRLAAAGARDQAGATDRSTRATSVLGRAAAAAAPLVDRLRSALRGVRDGADEVPAPMQRAAGSFDLLSRRVVTLVAGVVGLTAALRFVGTGIGFNEQIESSTFGIATLITAQAKLTDANRQQLTGVQALDTAYGLAERQVTALRIAGLKTAAETPQLLEAFQQATGAGLSAGLNLDEIRQVTVGITQAAGALGVPMVQLNQEVRSILDGTIDINSRVAKSLGITNEQVKAERERGTLAQFLVKRLEAFNVASERSNSLLVTQRSNLQEMLGVFAGEATKPLFDSFKRAANAALQDAFDVDAATIGPKFAPLIALAQSVFGTIGTLIERAISGSVAGAQALGAYFREHRVELVAIASAAGDVLRAVALIIVDVVKFGAAIARVLVDSGLLAGVLRTVAQAITVAWQTAKVLTAVLAGLALVLSPILVPLAAVAVAGAAAAAPLTALAVVIAGVAVAVNTIAAAQERARKRQQELNDAQAQAITQAPALIAEYARLGKQIEDGALKGDELDRASKRLKEIKAKLIELSPEYRKALEDETKSLREQAAEAGRVREELRKNAQEKVRVAAAELASLEAQRQSLLEAQKAARGNDLGGISTALAALERKVGTARAALDGLRQAFGDIAGADPVRLAPVVVTTPDTVNVTPTGTPGNVGAKAKNDAAQIAAAEVAAAESSFKTQKAILDEKLETFRLSYARYFADLETAYRESNARQRQALITLLAVTTDDGERAKILGQLQQFEDERIRVAEESVERRRELELGLARQVQDAQVQLLQAEGNVVQARTAELERQFGDLIRRLEAEGNAVGLRIVRALFNAERTKVELAQVGEAVERTQGDLQRRLEAIDARRESGALSALGAQRETVAAYQATRAELEKTRQAWEGWALSMADPAALDFVQQLGDDIAEIDREVTNLSFSWKRLGSDIADTAQARLGEFLGTAITNVEDLDDAVRSLLQGVVADAQRMVGDLLSAEIFEKLRGLFGGAGQAAAAAQTTASATALGAAGAAVTTSATATGVAAASLSASGGILLTAAGALQAAAAALAVANAAGGIPGFAGGGYVSGPGTSTSDSILARLSDGEFVIRAAAVRRVGIGYLQEINRLGGTAPRRVVPTTGVRGYTPGFAEGGLVRVPRAGGGGDSGASAQRVDVSGGVTVEVAPAPGAVLTAMRSREGRDAQKQVWREERDTLRAIIGVQG
ncbi:hypothetical protein [Roseisolibacter agri]|uniref:Uncharacterized protein n=1 Tax=Roseisolibacter agri TaxID=2014610 RepID=A0AA37V2C7_9BACT|nr:hypothetical protein [Roseisolibacter agri]GLC25062.1 hypothetical protein rosag_15750 [Roseisolibacter agri]